MTADNYDVHNYRSIPPLAAYIDRIGADQLNFRRFMIRVWRGRYYSEKVLITLATDGSIKVTDPEFAPTKDEETMIKAALTMVEFPKSIGATDAGLDALHAKIGQRDGVFGFWCQRTSKWLMAQQRIEGENGKRYMPWTFWSDGEWRSMEPDGKLPFWKPKEMMADKIMIHEGAKAAAFAHALCTGQEEHPWKDDLQEYEHWGMIGGALAPHRADYEELYHRRPSEVVYFCDNDNPGKSALPNVSRNYGRSLKGLVPDRKWPVGWDIADPMPGALFSGTRYIGDQFKGLLTPATFATENVKVGDSKKTVKVIRREFREEWQHCVKPEVFVHKDWPNQIWSAAEFNNKVRPYSDADDTARLLKADSVGKGLTLHYIPAQKPGLIVIDDQLAINTHQPSRIKAEKGDVGPWFEYLKHLIPDEGDRMEVKRWVATLLARPDNKIHYGLLLVSETQGVGKTTLGEKVLLPLLGADNVSFPSEQDIVESAFNPWSAHKRLAVVNEIYAGHSWKAYNKLKSYATDKVIQINQKFQTNYQLENWLHILACSNSPRALLLSSDDRRWLVPTVTEEVKPVQYWKDFNDWLRFEGGHEKIKWWSERFTADGGFIESGQTAPMTSAKKEMIEEGYSQGMTIMKDTLDALKRTGREFVLTDKLLIEKVKTDLYEGRHSDKLERPLTARKMAKAAHLYVAKDTIFVGSTRAHLISNKPSLINGEFDGKTGYIKTLNELEEILSL